jgi:hypothetical protein
MISFSQCRCKCYFSSSHCGGMYRSGEQSVAANQHRRWMRREETTDITCSTKCGSEHSHLCPYPRRKNNGVIILEGLSLSISLTIRPIWYKKGGGSHMLWSNISPLTLGSCVYSTEPHRMDFSLVTVKLHAAKNVWSRRIEPRISALISCWNAPDKILVIWKGW